jgi:hypothetical protein
LVEIETTAAHHPPNGAGSAGQFGEKFEVRHTVAILKLIAKMRLFRQGVPGIQVDY